MDGASDPGSPSSAKRKRTPVQHEFELQRDLVRWLSAEYPDLPVQGSAVGALLYGDKKQRARQSAVLKSKGVSNGYPDVMIHAGGGHGKHGLGIELKCGNNKQSPAQKDWERKLKLNEYEYIVVWTLEDAKDQIEKYLCS